MDLIGSADALVVVPGLGQGAFGEPAFYALETSPFFSHSTNIAIAHFSATGEPTIHYGRGTSDPVRVKAGPTLGY